MPTHIEFGIHPLCVNDFVDDLRTSLGELAHNAQIGSYSFSGAAVSSTSPLNKTKSVRGFGDIGNQRPGSGQTDPTLFYWMINHGILDARKWDVVYTNVSGTTQRVGWYCTSVDERFARAHVREGTGDYHDGVDLIVGKREAVEWTYSNTYETEVPGKGKVTVFAGTFRYTIAPSVQDAVFKDGGTGSVKMYLDPDDGKWAITHFELHDPSLTLRRANEATSILAEENPEAIEAFGSDIAISFDGATKVNERILVDTAGKLIRHGIMRALPTIYWDWRGKKFQITYKVESATMDGVNVPFQVTGDAAQETIRVGDPTRLLPKGRHRFGLSYSMRAPLSEVDGLYDVQWNVTGSYWAFPIRHAWANVTVPGNAQILRADASTYSDSRGYKKAIAAARPDGAYFSTSSPLASGNGLVISIAFAKTTDAPVNLPVLFARLQIPAYKEAFAALFVGGKPEPWLGEGTASEGHVVAIRGTQYEYYSECKPHDCAENTDYVLFTRDAKEAWALVALGSNMRSYGTPNAELSEFLHNQYCNDRKMSGQPC